MAKNEITARARELYEDELQHAIEHDDEVDMTRARMKAAMRLGRLYEGRDISALWYSLVDGIARQVERGFEVDIASGQFRIGGAIRVAPLTFVPLQRAHAKDLLAHFAIREAKAVEHAAKWAQEGPAILAVVERMEAHGGDPTLIDACPDLFAIEAAA